MSHPLPIRRCHAKGGSGFTLMEVMIVVAIVAILARVALPSYAEYVLRGQLPEAFSYLSDYQLKMEQFYQDNRNYGTAGGTACATGTNAPAWNTFSPTGARYFTFSCSLGGDNQSYTVTATGGGGRTTGYVYTVNSGGVKATTKFAGATVAKSCWASRATDC
jgi:type IV pilus assembly protein PilE